MTRRCFLTRHAAMATLAMIGLGSAQAQGYPLRPITLTLPWAAGGGTDFATRTLAVLLEKELGQPVNVVNRTGGSGVVGHVAAAEAVPDGYSIGVISAEIGMLHQQGLTKLRHTDYEPITRMFIVPAGISVNASGPYKTVADILGAAKASPGKLKGSGTGQGGIWHLALAGWLKEQGLPPNAIAWVPSQGAAPAFQDLAADSIALVTASPGEGKAMMDAGKVKGLAVMASSRIRTMGQIPTLKEASGSDFTLASWAAVVAPKGTPQPMLDRLSAALRKVIDSPGYQEPLESRGFIVGASLTPQQLGDWMARSDKSLGELMRDAGIVK